MSFVFFAAKSCRVAGIQPDNGQRRIATTAKLAAGMPSGLTRARAASLWSGVLDQAPGDDSILQNAPWT
jgi:hypothetical protein